MPVDALGAGTAGDSNVGVHSVALPCPLVLLLQDSAIVKITNFEIYLITVPPDRLFKKIEDGSGPGGAPARAKSIHWVILKLITDEGVAGWGECSFTPGRERALIQLLRDYCQQHVVGKCDPFDVERIWSSLYEAGGEPQSRHPGLLATTAIGGIEMACWDIVGKTLGQPIHKLLGGACHEKLRAYTYMHFWWDPGESPRKAADVAAQLVEEGFTALKLDPIYPLCPSPRNVSLEELRYSEEVVRAIRDAVGDRCDILIGTHGQFTPAAAIRFARRLEDYDPFWLEEPVPPENVDAMRRVAESTSIPIATGERLATKWECQPVLQQQAAHILQVNVALNGILESKKIAGIAESHYVQIAPFMFAGPVAAAATVQLDLCSPNFLIQEGIGKWDDIDAELVQEPIRWEDGYLIPPARSGLGVELDEHALAKYAQQV